MDLNKVLEVDRNSFSLSVARNDMGNEKSAPELKQLGVDRENVECLDTISSQSSLLISVLPALCPLHWAGCVTAAWSQMGTWMESRGGKLQPPPDQVFV